MDTPVDNPFRKEAFPTYRDWEDALLRFFVKEAKAPQVADWEALARSADRRTVAFSALLLSCLVESKPTVSRSSAVLHQVYRQLSVGGMREYNAWLREDWLNVARVANRFKAELRHH